MKAFLGNDAFHLSGFPLEALLPIMVQERLEAEPGELCIDATREHLGSVLIDQATGPSTLGSRQNSRVAAHPRQAIQGRGSAQAVPRMAEAKGVPRQPPREGQEEAKTVRRTSGETLTGD